MLQRIAVLTFTLAFGAGSCSESTTAPSSSSAVADSVLTAIRESYQVPGMVAAVVRTEGVEALSAVGVRRLGDGARMTVDDRFHLGSNTKALTATLLGMLVEDGALSWSSAPLETFPELASTIHPAHLGITLTQLLQHRGGIEPLTSFTVIPPLAGSSMEQRRSGSGLLLQLAPPVPVGSYLYSNGGYAIAAAMGEAQTGKPWEELLQSRLLRPLGIAATFGWPAATDARQPWGHEDVGSSFVPHQPGAPVDSLRMPAVIAPAGDLSMSVRDYAKFIRLHLRGLRGQPALLSAESFIRLHTPEGFYAMGWGEVDLEGVRTAIHDGTTGTFWATVWMQPSRDIAVTVLVNAGGGRANAAATDAATALLQRYGGVAPAIPVAALGHAR